MPTRSTNSLHLGIFNAPRSVHTHEFYLSALVSKTSSKAGNRTHDLTLCSATHLASEGPRRIVSCLSHGVSGCLFSSGWLLSRPVMSRWQASPSFVCIGTCTPQPHVIGAFPDAGIFRCTAACLGDVNVKTLLLYHCLSEHIRQLRLLSVIYLFGSSG